MQQQSSKRSELVAQESVPRFPVPSEISLNLRAFRRGLDYPCNCRYCTELKKVSGPGVESSLAAIDVYDLPDAIDAEISDFFH